MNTLTTWFLAISFLTSGSFAGQAPAYATIAGVVMGRDPITILEKQLGVGKVQAGGHSDSGRIWKFKTCTIVADAFERRGNSLILDHIRITDWRGALKDNYPFNRYQPFALGELVYGEPLRESLLKLKRGGFNALIKDNRVECQDKVELNVFGRKQRFLYSLTLSGVTGLDTVVVTCDKETL